MNAFEADVRSSFHVHPSSFGWPSCCGLCSAGARVRPGYPNRPVRMIVGQPAGGNADLTARVYAQRLGERFGVQFVVDNRGGGGGVIATELTARAQPDGYTLFLGHTALGTNPALIKNLPFDTRRDLAPISLLIAGPNIVVVGRQPSAAQHRRHHQGGARAARQAQLCLVGRCHFDPRFGRAVQVHGQGGHAARRVQGRAGRHGRDIDRRIRPELRGHGGRAAADPRRQAARARRDRRQALADAARHSDGVGVGRARLRIQGVVRVVRAGPAARQPRQPAAPRGGRDFAEPRTCATA